MPAAFPRFSSLSAEDFQSVRFSERMAALYAELESVKALVEHQCLSAIVLVTTIVYLLARTVDSMWMLPFILPIIAIGVASLQHALALYRHHIRQEALPVLCEGIGRLRYTIGDAPDLCFDRMVRAGLLPRHGMRLVDDVIHGEHRGHQFSLAMADLSHGDNPFDDHGGTAFQGLLVSIQWPEVPAALPRDDLATLIDGTQHIGLTWSEGYLMLAIPCQWNPFDLGGLFLKSDQLASGLFRAAVVMQIPHRLIDYMSERDQTAE